MHNPVVIKHFVTLTKLFQKEPNLLLWYIELLSHQVLVQVPLIAVLHDKVKVIFRGNLKFHTVK
jgi:hypothetical protein